MTAVASPPTFPPISRPAWGNISGSPMNTDQVRGMFAPRKQLPRSNSSSSVSSSSSNTTVATNGSQPNGTPLSAASDLSQWSANTGPRKRPPPKNSWPPGKADLPPDSARASAGRPGSMAAHHNPLQPPPGPPSMSQQMAMRPLGHEQLPPSQPVLYLLSLNGTFERKTIAVPFAPDSLRIGRQTNQKTVPTPANGFFDSKVLSRQHAEIYAERNGKIYIRDIKSSNGTFVNGTRLSQENRESEPHELQTADHLELGIDIVSEDQKTVVHHKVAAKVEHAGFLSSTNNVLDMNFGDLDPANGTMLVPNGPFQVRARGGSNASMAANGGRMMPAGGAMGAQINGMAQQRPFFFSPIATDQILKRLANEMRNARLQAQDLNRTNQFVNTLLSKDDVKDLDKPDVREPTKPMMNGGGGGVPFRPDAKTRFSDPPAPPPQQPLPEKPDVPSLRRGPTERPKLGSANTAPARQENLNQVIQLTEALNSAKRDMESQTARMRELEFMLQREREARELAEDLAKRLEESAKAQMMMGGSAEGAAFLPVIDAASPPAQETETRGFAAAEEPGAAEDAAPDSAAAALQSRIDTMDGQMRDLREQMTMWRHRCEAAETERDEGRKTLADMVVQLRADEARRVSSGTTGRSRSRRGRSGERSRHGDGVAPRRTDGSELAPGGEQAADELCSGFSGDTKGGSTLADGGGGGGGNGGSGGDNGGGTPPAPAAPTTATGQGHHHLQAGLPYASMLGVVLIGMSLMVYINGWQSPPPRLER